jgi:hypothetical protein
MLGREAKHVRLSEFSKHSTKQQGDLWSYLITTCVVDPHA